MIRPSEVNLLIGDATKAQKKLLWKPTCDFSNLVKKMIDCDLVLESSKNF
jgi:GDPmannose 4,6-dehydratase